jgi:hypothetical protein
MKLIAKWLVGLLLTAITVAANAQTYNVNAQFKEYLTNGKDTFFNGTFDWDGSSVTNLHGTMNSSMYPLFDPTGTIELSPTYPVDATGSMGGFPLMNLTYQLDGTSINGNIVTASVFLKNTTDVYRGGGYNGVASQFIRYGGGYPGFLPYLPGETPNENAFFTLAFDMSTMTGVVDQMVYADCTQGGLMGQHMCMAGEITGTSPMYATPLSLNITPAAVPVPAAIWLFGSAIAGLMGINRKRAVAI